MISYVPLLEEVKVLWLEDTLSVEDHRNFILIYESLLLEGKAGNLTDLTLGMVLAEKPLAWLQVMHERLKYLIISSETFKEKRKLSIMLKLKQNESVKEREKVNTLRGSDTWGLVEKGKEKGPVEKAARQ